MYTKKFASKTSSYTRENTTGNFSVFSQYTAYSSELRNDALLYFLLEREQEGYYKLYVTYANK